MSEDPGGTDAANIITNKEAWDYFLDGPRDVFTCEYCGSEAHRGNPRDMPGALYAEVDNEPAIICVECNDNYDWNTIEANIRKSRQGSPQPPIAQQIPIVRAVVRPISTRVPVPLSVHEVDPEQRTSLLFEQAVFVGRLGTLFAIILAVLAGISVFAAAAGALFVSPGASVEWLASTADTYLEIGQFLIARPSLILVVLGIGYLAHLVEYQRHLTDVEPEEGRTRPNWHYLTFLAVGGLVGWLAWVLSQIDDLGGVLLPLGVLTWSASTILLVYFLHETLIEDRWSYGLRIHSALWKFPVQYAVALMLYDGLIGLPGPDSIAFAVAVIPPVIGTLYAVRRTLAFTEQWGHVSRRARQLTDRVRLMVPWQANAVGRNREDASDPNQFGQLDDPSREETDQTADGATSLTREQELKQTREWASYLESELKDREDQMQDLEARLASVRQELQDAREAGTTETTSTDERADLLSDLFDIRDNFRRALDAEALIEDDAAGEFREGIELIDSQIRSILEREGVEEIDTSGDVDPSKHQVVKTVPTADADPGEIVDVYQLGYRQDDLILREARVVVAEEPPADDGTGPNDDGSRINRGDDAA